MVIGRSKQTFMKKPIIIANWKMNLNLRAVERFFGHFSLSDADLAKVQVVLCPSFVFVERVRFLIGNRPLALGGQNVFWQERGAFTGEVGAEQLADSGCRYVIVGHSERRELFQETDTMVNGKIKAAIKYGLTPIVCLGESYQEKEAGQTKKVLEEKIRGCFNELRSFELRKLVIAYEPLWAISTSTDTSSGDLADDPESAQVVHKNIRRVVADLYDARLAETVPVIYGGSVTPENIAGFAGMADIDGVLVGGSSKEPEPFQKIIAAYLN